MRSQDLPTRSFKVPGLETPVEILLDEWAVPHIYAGSQHDAFLAQGYNVARERLWQIDLWRKRGLGELARDFGPSYLEQDRATRLFLFREDLDDEWAHYGASARATLEAFVAGINAYVTLARSDPTYLPIEFRLLDYLPAFWRAEEILRIRSHSIVQNVISEVERVRVTACAGLAADHLRVGLQPAWQTEIPAGLDCRTIPDDVLETYLLATSGVDFQASPPVGQVIDPSTHGAAASDGSNNWVIAPGKSATGRPIFANDPHRGHSAPPLRYIVHLHAPGLDVIGASQSFLPGVSTGHNGRVAFGFTVFQIDQEDLYVYDTDPEDRDAYRYDGGWEQMRLLPEHIDVRSDKAAEVTHRFTRHGPIIHTDAARNKAYAVRTVLFKPGAAPYVAGLAYQDAENWAAFRTALRCWYAPSLSFVGADIDGNIGWAPTGLTPVRPNWDGLLPVPGDGRYEWNGFLDMDGLPSETNPPRGWVGSANQMSLPPDYPYRERKLGFEWSDPARFTRLTEAFENTSEVSLDDCRRLQMDLVCIPARRLCALTAGLRPEEPDLARALELFGSWDHALAADSAAAALFEVWFTRHLCPGVVAHMVPGPGHALIPEADTRVVLELLEGPDPELGEVLTEARDELLRTTLLAAVREMEELLGDDWSRWSWGGLHKVLFEHPLAGIVDEEQRTRFNVGPQPLGGSDLTLNKAAYRASDFGVTHGPSWRLVADVGNWNDSWAMNAPGQSGDPLSPHYRDLMPLWAAGQYIRLPYTRGAVEAAARRRIQLEPA